VSPTALAILDTSTEHTGLIPFYLCTRRTDFHTLPTE